MPDIELSIRVQLYQHSTSCFHNRISQKPQKDSGVVNLFALSGSACAKDARRMFMKLTPICFYRYSSFNEVRRRRLSSSSSLDNGHLDDDSSSSSVIDLLMSLGHIARSQFQWKLSFRVIKG